MAESGTHKANHAAMRQAAGEINDKANIIKGLQNTLEGHKDDLMRGWGGEAAMTFSAVHREFNEDFTKVIQALEGMHEALTHTAITFEAKEQENREAASEVQRLLAGG
ncbi:WXG100 family type VII secretion target [Actinoallomurus sp. NPDC052274]|uniref:WXG100 family type VII secretion target n=1 Tax=Actinoallomurus sp. NPDC052274 TaxID=3155420 RepID=UPI0034422C64